MLKATNTTLEDYPGFAESQAKLSEIDIETRQNAIRISELEKELAGRQTVTAIDVEVGLLLDDKSVSVLTDHRVELKDKLRRREVLKRADAKQRQTCDAEQRKAGNEIRKSRKVDHRAIVKKLNAALKVVEAITIEESQFLSELSQITRESEGSSQAGHFLGVPNQQGFPPVEAWRATMRRVGLLD